MNSFLLNKLFLINCIQHVCSIRNLKQSYKFVFFFMHFYFKHKNFVDFFFIEHEH